MPNQQARVHHLFFSYSLSVKNVYICNSLKNEQNNSFWPMKICKIQFSMSTNFIGTQPHPFIYIEQ